MRIPQSEILTLGFFIILFVCCLIVTTISFLNGLDRAKCEKEETLRKLKNLAEIERIREEKDEQI